MSSTSSSQPSQGSAAANPTQYDQIGQSYESMKRVPGSLLERNNLRDAIVPFLTLRPGSSEHGNSGAGAGAGGDGGAGISVLDLACGTGFYSRLVLEWASTSSSPVRRVVGMDISPTMVAAAERSSENLDAFRQGRLKFAVGDATKPLPREIFSDDPNNTSPSSSSSSNKFDVVLGAWLLNYAPSTQAMTDMFANISASLRPGGHFVGVTPHPAWDLDGFAALHADQAEILRRFGVAVSYVSPLASGEGYHTRVTARVVASQAQSQSQSQPAAALPSQQQHHVQQSVDEISFENFHLRRQCYETAARAGGMRGALKWVAVDLPRTDEESLREYGVGIDYWDGCEERPHFGVLVVQK
ncbi:uncharacterized protein Z520_04897 [Fonsecaea multimorphosa CBS 102226]|uniref:Methyltransferase domain-containing protein n=1 Tax=Fonsecaea multimorphosa CBS 102226 TaxID=1442371 RepID=A0A0D2IQR3_9EURO|nr:uncharacterized protein Z520_04897 [Fonsecaea multimorphosa CBS 102226]KIX99321.1 hypothetical protein Z520_04897 [Fonsecaea multimorphosa CBS 102226]OAL25652.1 hypothetical protein AYO22_04641 [Fonsecaea multimorphosa]